MKIDQLVRIKMRDPNAPLIRVYKVTGFLTSKSIIKTILYYDCRIGFPPGKLIKVKSSEIWFQEGDLVPLNCKEFHRMKLDIAGNILT